MYCHKWCRLRGRLGETFCGQTEMELLTWRGQERKEEGFCNFTLPVTFIWNLGLTVALQVPQYGPLADYSI